ncbi:MAG TPA: sporulation protein YqfC [Clostridiales bacterium]|nr:MAG: sporulation protein YqfC [Clostridiales bacterium GWD2_32_59]HAN10152.1 sporulation protein YqfC [Clostridiales bacterium]
MESLKKKIYSAVDIPKETFLNIPLATIVGNEEIVIENYKAVLDYKPDTIRINTKIGHVKISGKNMNIKYIRKDEIFITGIIKNIQYGS